MDDQFVRKKALLFLLVINSNSEENCTHHRSLKKVIEVIESG